MVVIITVWFGFSLDVVPYSHMILYSIYMFIVSLSKDMVLTQMNMKVNNYFNYKHDKGGQNAK